MGHAPEGFVREVQGEDWKSEKIRPEQKSEQTKKETDVYQTNLIGKFCKR